MTTDAPAPPAIRTPAGDAWKRFRRNRLARAALAVLGILVAVSLVTGLIFACGRSVTGYGYEEQALVRQYEPPSWSHWMGTDLKGRDLLTRLMAGSWVSLIVGLLGTSVSLVIGVMYGAVAGYAGGRVEQVLMRIVDILYGLPTMIFVILFSLMFMEHSAGVRMVALFTGIGAISWLTMARIVRGQMLSLKEKAFVEAARALGARPSRIVTRHLLPNLLGPVVVYVTLTIPAIMLWESFISFLGLGIQPPYASWGTLISEGAGALNPVKVYWWLIFFPSAFLGVTLLCLNAVGDGLRDALDVR